jgi:hypothetical protein
MKQAKTKSVKAQDSTPKEEVVASVMGRPTKYDPAFCQKVVQLGKLGKSFEQMAAQLNVSYRTLCNWRDNHDDFFHALEEAQAQEQAWWEEQAQTYLVNQYQGNTINAQMWSRSMAARFPKKYSERNRVEVSGKDGDAILVDHVNVAMEELFETIKKKL